MDDEGSAPAIDFQTLAGDRTAGYVSPGALKRKLRRRRYRTPAAPRPSYVELRTASSFSFLDGASLPEDLVQRAAELDLPAVALLDRNGVYGAPRFHQAAGQAGIRAIVGAEIVLEAEPGETAPPSTPETRLSLLVASRRGYRNLCRLLTTAARGRAKGEARIGWSEIEGRSEGLWCLTGGDEGPLARTIERQGLPQGRKLLDRLGALFEGRLHVEIQRHRLRSEEHRNRALVELARSLKLPLVATNGVRYARPEDKPLHDIMTCIREHTHLDAAGRLLGAHRERYFKTAAEMARLFADLPEAVTESAELARAARVHPGRSGLPLSRLPGAAGRDADLLPAPAVTGGRPEALSAA